MFSLCSSPALSALFSITTQVALTSLAEAIDEHIAKHVLKNTESGRRCGVHLCAATLTNYIAEISRCFFQWFPAGKKQTTKPTIFGEV